VLNLTSIFPTFIIYIYKMDYLFIRISERRKIRKKNKQSQIQKFMRFDVHKVAGRFHYFLRNSTRK
jgi:hypothetical protein